MHAPRDGAMCGAFPERGSDPGFLSTIRPACYAATPTRLRSNMMKVHHLAVLGAALLAAATTSSTSWAQDAAPLRTTDGPTDHSRFVGDFAIGFLGFQS